jgi:ribosome biogenesis GTPase
VIPPGGADRDPKGTVITVVRGGCEIVCGDERRELRLLGRSALRGVELAVGDEVEFDAAKGTVREVLPRRTRLERRRPEHDSRQRQVIAANMDRLAIVVSVRTPPFRAGLVDRFQLAAYAGGLEAILVVNKVDLLEGAPLPEEIRVFEAALPVVPVSAHTGLGLDALRRRLERSQTVLAGHSGVGKSSLLNALEPELRLETGELGRRGRRGRHTTRSSILIRLPGGAIVVDTPGIREVASGAIDPDFVDRLYPDVAALEAGCHFRNCRHAAEPDCAVQSALEAGHLPRARYESHQTLLRDLEADEA